MTEITSSGQWPGLPCCVHCCPFRVPATRISSSEASREVAGLPKGMQAEENPLLLPLQGLAFTFLQVIGHHKKHHSYCILSSIISFTVKGKTKTLVKSANARPANHQNNNSSYCLLSTYCKPGTVLSLLNSNSCYKCPLQRSPPQRGFP